MWAVELWLQPDAFLVAHFVDDFEFDALEVALVVLANGLFGGLGTCNLTVDLGDFGQIAWEHGLSFISWIWCASNDDAIMLGGWLCELTWQRSFVHRPRGVPSVTLCSFLMLLFLQLIAGGIGREASLPLNSNIFVGDFFLLHSFDGLLVKFELDVDLLFVVDPWLSGSLPDVLMELSVSIFLGVVVDDDVLERTWEI